MDFKEFKNIYQKRKVVEVANNVPQNPLLSVCVQTYNQKDFIESCLEGILEQETDFEFEVLLGEDDSTDGTREICLSYAGRYPSKIRLFLHHRENQIKVLKKETGNFNALFNFFSAKGKYISFCEGDDIWRDPSKLQKQLNLLRTRQEYSFSYHRYECIDESGEILLSPGLNQPQKDLDQEEISKVEYHPLLLTTCFRNNFQELPFEMAEVINVDTFLISILGQKGKAKFQKEICPSQYRKHSFGIWSAKTGDTRLLLKLNTYRKLILYYKRQNKPKLVSHFQKQSLYYHRALSKFYFTRADLVNALKQLFKAI